MNELHEKIFAKLLNDGIPPKRDKYRADNYQYLDQFDTMEIEKSIRIEQGRYIIPISILQESHFWKNEKEIINKVLKLLRVFYQEDPNKFRDIDEMITQSNEFNIDEKELQRALIYIIEAEFTRGSNYDQETGSIKGVFPHENVLRYSTIEEKIEKDRKRRKDREEKYEKELETAAPYNLLTYDLNPPYVDADRLNKLNSCSNDLFDLSKLVALCNELNCASNNKLIFTIGMLVRAILDHIPPIFGFKKFGEVANNYSNGCRSFKEAMLQLENSSRKIADSYLHTQIRKKEELPTMVQVDFRQSLDMLLQEVLRILKK